MRTTITILVVAIAVLFIAAYATGFVAISTEHPPGKYLVQIEVNTNMLRQAAQTAEDRANQVKEAVQGNALSGADLVKGTVAAVDSSTGRFTMTTQDHETKIIHVSPATTISGSQLNALAPGDRVAVHCGTNDGNTVARSITILERGS